MSIRQDQEDLLEYQYGDWEEERVVAPGDKQVGVYLTYRQPLHTYSEFLLNSQAKNWLPNWPRH